MGLAPRIHDTISVGILILDMAGTVLEANRRALELLGTRRGALLGTHILEAPFWQAARYLREDGTEILPETSLVAEFLGRGRGSAGPQVMAAVRDGDEQVMWALVDCRLLDGADGAAPDGIVVTLTDITPQKRAEVTLERVAAELHGVLHALPDLSLRLDRHGRVVDFHAGDEVDKGALPEEFLGRTPEEILPDGVGGRVRKALAAARLSKQAQSLEAAFDGADGRRWFEFRAAALPEGEGIILVRETTRERRAVEELALSEQRYRSIFESATVGIVVVDRETRFIDVNPHLLAVLGLPASRFLGLFARDLRDGHVVELVERALGGTPGRYQGAYRPTFTGSLAEIDLIVDPLVDAGGAVIGAMGIFNRFEAVAR